jgi:hypothetical protein
MLLVAAALGATGCPSLPPPERRPAARLLSLSRAAAPEGALHARLEWRGDGAALAPTAVDWELAAGGQTLVRGRSRTLEFVIVLPPQARPLLAAGAEVRLRGAIHLAGADRTALAPFDEAARLP